MSLECKCVHYSNGRCKKKSDEVNTAWCFEGICDVREPSNADRIRAMSDEELARFLSDRLAKESCHRLYGEGRMLTATEIEAIGHTWYCTWMQWLKQPAEDE